jgi:hypothetical protein
MGVTRPNGNSPDTPSKEKNLTISVDLDPRKILAEVEREKEEMAIHFASSMAKATSEGGAKQLSLEPDRRAESPTSRLDSSDTLVDELDSLRVEFASIESSHPSDCGLTAQSDMPSEVPHHALVPYIIALKLESAGCDWATVMHWVKYLFSDGPDGHAARQDEDTYIQRNEISELANDTLARMSLAGGSGNKRLNSRRIVVTNIAADAGVYELAVVFDEYDMYDNTMQGPLIMLRNPTNEKRQDITLLKERHPLNGTRAAYIDFFDTQSAWAASRVIESIFGLKLRVRLASDVF